MICILPTRASMVAMDEYDGPVCYHEAKNRSKNCSDVLMLFLFLFLVALMLVTGMVALMFGSPLRLLYGHDSFGNICGANNDPIDSRSFTGEDMRSRPYVFFFDLTNPRESLKICVRKCPDRRLNALDDLKEFTEETGSNLCRYGLSPVDFARSNTVNISAADCQSVREERTDVEILSEDARDGCLIMFKRRQDGYGDCPVLPVSLSSPILNRCVPSRWNPETSTVYDFYGYLNSFDFFSQVMADFYASYREIIGLTIAAFVLSIIVVLIFYFVPTMAVQIVLVGVVTGSTVATSLLWWAWATLKQFLDSRLLFGKYFILLEEMKNESVLLVFAVAATTLTILLLAVLIILRRRLHLQHVVRMVVEGSRCIKEVPTLLVLPLFTFVVLCMYFIGWVFTMLCFATADYPTFTTNEIIFSNSSVKDAIPLTSFPTVEFQYYYPFLRFMWIVFALALIWVSEFILGCQQMVVAGAVSMWYFEREKKHCRTPIWSSIKQTVFYHLGSVALGSLLITTFKIPRIIMIQLRILLRGKSSRLTDSFNTCCRPCWWMYEKFLRYVNHNAYAIVALQGSNFLQAGEEAHHLLADSGLPMVGANCVGDFILFLGKCTVTTIVASIGIVSMKYDAQLHLFAIPLLLCCIFAYFIAHSVISLYEMVIDTIFLCYCEDLRINDTVDESDVGSACFASDSLREFMATQPTSSDAVHLRTSENGVV